MRWSGAVSTCCCHSEESTGARNQIRVDNLIVSSAEMTYSDFAKGNMNRFSAICEPLQEVFPYIESEVQPHHLRRVASVFGGVILQVGGETAGQLKAGRWYNKRLHGVML